MPPKTKKDSLFLSTLVYCTEGRENESTFMAAESAHREATWYHDLIIMAWVECIRSPMQEDINEASVESDLIA